MHRTRSPSTGISIGAFENGSQIQAIFIHHPQRELHEVHYARCVGTHVDRATRVQSSVPLVRQLVDGRRGLGCRKNRDRLLDGDIARKFMTSVLNLPQVRGLLSSEHFSVDGTLIEAWASMKSFVPKDGGDALPSGGGAGRGGRNAERDFHGEKRANDTHFSTTDPDARLFRKGAGKEAKLCHMGHLMTENRNG